MEVAVQNDPNPISEIYLVQLETAMQVSTQRTEIEAELAFYDAEMIWAARQGFNIVSDQENPSLVDQRAWLNKEKSLRASIQVAYTFYQDGDYSGMNGYLDQIPTILNLNEQEIIDLNIYKNFINILANEISEGGNEASLNIAEQNQINTLALSGEEFVNQYIKTFLTEYYGFNFSPIQEKSSFGNSIYYPISNPIRENSVNTELDVYPNPANETIYFKSKFDLEGQIQIFDTNGKLVFSEKIDQKSEILKIQLTDFESGVYFYRVSGNSNGIIQGRLLIQ